MLKKSLIVGFLFASFAPPTFAYFDPGTGAYLVQGLIAFIAAVFFYLRHPIEYIKKLFKDLKGKFKK